MGNVGIQCWHYIRITSAAELRICTKYPHFSVGIICATTFKVEELSDVMVTIHQDQHYWPGIWTKEKQLQSVSNKWNKDVSTWLVGGGVQLKQLILGTRWNELLKVKLIFFPFFLTLKEHFSQSIVVSACVVENLLMQP